MSAADCFATAGNLRCPGERREIAPEIELDNQGDSCVLAAWPSGPITPLVRELFVVVDRWSADRSTIYAGSPRVAYSQSIT